MWECRNNLVTHLKPLFPFLSDLSTGSTTDDSNTVPSEAYVGTTELIPTAGKRSQLFEL